MKEKFQLDYVLGKVSTNLLWQKISTTQGLSEWFADDVRLNGIEYTFVWNDEEEKAVLKMSRLGVYVRFHWTDDDEPKSFFEIRISVDELTEDVILNITDFCNHDDYEDCVETWNMQIDELMKNLGLKKV